MRLYHRAPTDLPDSGRNAERPTRPGSDERIVAHHSTPSLPDPSQVGAATFVMPTRTFPFRLALQSSSRSCERIIIFRPSLSDLFQQHGLPLRLTRQTEFPIFAFRAHRCPSEGHARVGTSSCFQIRLSRVRGSPRSDWTESSAQPSTPGTLGTTASTSPVRLSVVVA